MPQARQGRQGRKVPQAGRWPDETQTGTFLTKSSGTNYAWRQLSTSNGWIRRDATSHKKGQLSTPNGIWFSPSDPFHRLRAYGGQNTYITGSGNNHFVFSANFYPDTPGAADLGSTGSSWRRIYQTGATIRVSDPSLKDEIVDDPIPHAMDTIRNSTVYEYELIDGDGSVLAGFDASEMPDDIRIDPPDDAPDAALAVNLTRIYDHVWEAIREMDIRVTAIETGAAA